MPGNHAQTLLKLFKHLTLYCVYLSPIRIPAHGQLTTAYGVSACGHYIDVIMTTMASQITSLMVVYSTVYSDADQRKHHSSASLAFGWGIHRDRWIPRTKGQIRGKCFHLMTSSWLLNSSPPGHNGRHFTDGIFKHIFVNVNFCIFSNFTEICS